jgi:hypothetical protein
VSISTSGRVEAAVMRRTSSMHRQGGRRGREADDALAGSRKVEGSKTDLLAINAYAL